MYQRFNICFLVCCLTAALPVSAQDDKIKTNTDKASAGQKAGKSTKPSQNKPKKKSENTKRRPPVPAAKKQSPVSAAPATPSLAAAQNTDKARTWLDGKLVIVKRDLRQGKITQRSVWNRLEALERRTQKAMPAGYWDLQQAQAGILNEAKLPISTAVMATAAIRSMDEPLNEKVKASWEMLARISEKTSIYDLLVSLAADLDLKDKTPPGFGNNWYYYRGEAFAAKNQNDAAIKAFSQVKLGDRLFLAAKYARAMLWVEADKLAEAEADLRIIVNPTTRDATVQLTSTKLERYLDYAYLGLGRIQYEQKDYMTSLRSFRMVSRDGPLFYDALFEQSWALFLAGYPNHALGAMHGAQSPYFADRFNPEIPILRSFVYYWMCRYDDSRNALAAFIENHSDEVAKLGEFLDRLSLTPQKSYELFENLLSGVSEDSLGISRTLLSSAANTDTMILARDMYAETLGELDRLKKRGVLGSKRVGFLEQRLNKRLEMLRANLGQTYIADLQAMREHFIELRRQADFLYLELLMSEKEQLVGKELHADTKIQKVDMKRNIKGWARGTQSWAGSRKNEYWWDEVGYYVFRIRPECNVE